MDIFSWCCCRSCCCCCFRCFLFFPYRFPHIFSAFLSYHKCNVSSWTDLITVHRVNIPAACWSPCQSKNSVGWKAPIQQGQNKSTTPSCDAGNKATLQLEKAPTTPCLYTSSHPLAFARPLTSSSQSLPRLTLTVIRCSIREPGEQEKIYIIL